MATRPVHFFEQQFQRQVAESEYALNDFERAVLPHLRGDVLDAGCGLGNLALEAARAGCRVTALDASPTAISDLGRRANEASVVLTTQTRDLRTFRPTGTFDAVVCIGVAMFFRCADAVLLLGALRDAVRRDGIVAFNVLIEGTTYHGMFEPDDHCLFAERELDELLAGWTPLVAETSSYEAPGGTEKRFRTVIARRP